MKKEIQLKRRNFIKTLGLSSGLYLGSGGLIAGCSQKDEKKVLERLSNGDSGLVQSIYVNGDSKVTVTLESVDVLLKSDEILNFPRLIELEGDKLVLAYGKGRHGGAESRLAAFSDDGGKRWNDFPADSPWNDRVTTAGVLGYLKDGTITYISTFPQQFWDYRDLNKPWHKIYYSDPVWRLRRFSRSGELLEDTSFQVSNLPWKEAAYYCYGDLLDLGNGELLCPLGVVIPGIKMAEGSNVCATTFFARSTDNGKSFEYLSYIPPEVDGKPLFQGFNEPTLEILPGGEIICVARTGGYHPLYQVRSNDNGATWTKPVSTGWPAAKPDLCLLDNGILACSSGRGHYGHPQITHAMFSLDGRGEHWEAPFVFHTGPGCSYTSNMKKNGKLYVAYSHSSFSRDKSKYNLPYQSIKWAVMKVERTSR